MKLYHTILLYMATSFAAAQNQNPPDSEHFEIDPRKPIKASILLSNGNVEKGMIIKITDSAMLVSVSSQVGDVSLPHTIPILQINKIRIKRNAIVNGMAGGAVVGGLAGYGIGYISYQYDETTSDQNNKDNQKSTGALGALVGALPGALVGGIVGGVFTKRTYTINGKKANILKLKKILEN